MCYPPVEPVSLTPLALATHHGLPESHRLKIPGQPCFIAGEEVNLNSSNIQHVYIYICTPKNPIHLHSIFHSSAIPIHLPLRPQMTRQVSQMLATNEHLLIGIQFILERDIETTHLRFVS